MEYGYLSLDHEFRTVELQHTYTNPVVLVSPSTFNGGDPTTVRVKDVDSKSFKVALQEWLYLDGEHTTEIVSWIVLEAGSFQLPNGVLLLAGNQMVTHEF